jgi:hypothetical protein
MLNAAPEKGVGCSEVMQAILCLINNNSRNDNDFYKEFIYSTKQTCSPLLVMFKQELRNGTSRPSGNMTKAASSNRIQMHECRNHEKAFYLVKSLTSAAWDSARSIVDPD